MPDTAYDDLDRLIRVTEYLTAGEGGNPRSPSRVYNANDGVQSINVPSATPWPRNYATCPMPRRKSPWGTPPTACPPR